MAWQSMMGEGIGRAFENLQEDYWNEQNQRWAEEREKRDWARYGASIQARVKDAQLAGVHPLYALGASSFNASSPVALTQASSGGWTGSDIPGQDISRAQKANMTEDARRMADLQEELLQARIRTERLQGDRLEQDISRRGLQVPPPADPEASYSGLVNVPGATARDRIQITDSQSESRSSRAGEYAAAVPPGFQAYDLGKGIQLTLPSRQASEPLEALSESALLMLLHLAKSERDRPGTLAGMKDMLLPDWLRRRVDAVIELAQREGRGMDYIADKIGEFLRWQPRRRGEGRFGPFTR